LSVASAVTLNGHRIFLLLDYFKVNSGNVGYVLYALQLKLWLRSNPVSKSFLLRK